MIVYRKQERTTATLKQLSDLLALARSLDGNGLVEHEQAVDLLIGYGEFESGVTDAICAGDDSDNHVTRALRQAGVITGHIFRLSWAGDTGEMRYWTERLCRALERIASLDLPKAICVRVPEGYAHYGLYPETYLGAARDFFREVRPDRVACIGLRSIGTSLSSAVCAVLEDMGCRADSYTVRPRGHPFDRRVLLATSFEEQLRSLICSHFVIVDEGPGLSGTSLCCIAERLSELGIDDGRIVLFPSWNPDGTNFNSAGARKRWNRHRKFTAHFEDTWLASGRLKRRLPFGGLLDVSAGGWRSFFYAADQDSPAVHPYHERRKYLCAEDVSRIAHRRAGNGDAGAQERPPAYLIKFAGLGRYGRLKQLRALQLADRGIAPRVSGIADGFIVMQLVEGRPLSAHDMSRELLEALAGYLACVEDSFPVSQDVGYDVIVAMIRRNVLLGLGREWVERLSVLEGFRSVVTDGQVTAVDGRMMPHEWLLTAEGYIKTDGIDHHADQFFPGCQDIAWDAAGILVEFSLDRSGRDCLLERYRSFGNGKEIYRRLPFYVIAYLAYRLGYATFAADELGSSPDGRKFRAMAGRYASLLRQEVARVSGIIQTADTS